MAHPEPNPGVIPITRRPLLTSTGEVAAYELLYRLPAAAAGGEPTLAALAPLTDLLIQQLDSLTGGVPTIVRVPRTLLQELQRLGLPPNVVFDLDIAATVSPALVETCASLVAAGRTLSFAGSRVDDTVRELAPYARFIRFPHEALLPSQIAAVRALLRPGARLIATGLDQRAQFDRAQLAGYAGFEGQYYCEPIPGPAPSLTGQRVVYTKLLASLGQTDVVVTEIADLIKRDATITYRVLRCINSAGSGVRREVQSIQQAILMLGLGQVRKWAAVWALAGLGNSAHPELVNVAAIRARACELLALATGHDEGEYFLLGLCSLMEAMTGRPLAELLDMMPLAPEVIAALLGDRNHARSVLDLVQAYERGDWATATARAAALDIRFETLADSYSRSLQFVGEFLDSRAAA